MGDGSGFGLCVGGMYGEVILFRAFFFRGRRSGGRCGSMLCMCVWLTAGRKKFLLVLVNFRCLHC